VTTVQLPPPELSLASSVSGLPADVRWNDSSATTRLPAGGVNAAVVTVALVVSTALRTTTGCAAGISTSARATAPPTAACAADPPVLT
jgi:hypothetical protein